MGFKNISWNSRLPSDVTLFAEYERCIENELNLFKFTKTDVLKINSLRFYLKNVMAKSNRDISGINYFASRTAYEYNTKLILARASIEVKFQKPRQSDINEACEKIIPGDLNQWNKISEYVITGTKLNFTEVFKQVKIFQLQKKHHSSINLDDIALVEKEVLQHISINTIRKSKAPLSSHLPDAEAQFGVYCWRCSKYLTKSYLTRNDICKYLGAIIEEHYSPPLNEPLLCLSVVSDALQYKESGIISAVKCQHRIHSYINKLVKLQHQQQESNPMEINLIEGKAITEQRTMKNTYQFFKWIIYNFVSEDMQQVYLRSQIIGHQDYLKTCHNVISNDDSNNHFLKDYLIEIDFKEIIGIDNDIVNEQAPKLKKKRKSVSASDDRIRKTIVQGDEYINVYDKVRKTKPHVTVHAKATLEPYHSKHNIRDDDLKANWTSIELIVLATRNSSLPKCFELNDIISLNKNIHQSTHVAISVINTRKYDWIVEKNWIDGIQVGNKKKRLFTKNFINNLKPNKVTPLEPSICINLRDRVWALRQYNLKSIKYTRTGQGPKVIRANDNNEYSYKISIIQLKRWFDGIIDNMDTFLSELKYGDDFDMTGYTQQLIMNNRNLQTYPSNINMLLESLLKINTNKDKDQNQKISSTPKNAIVNRAHLSENSAHSLEDDNLPLTYLKNNAIVNIAQSSEDSSHSSDDDNLPVRHLMKNIKSKVLTDDAINIANKSRLKTLKKKDQEDEDFMVSSDNASSELSVPYETKLSVTEKQEKELIVASSDKTVTYDNILSVAKNQDKEIIEVMDTSSDEEEIIMPHTNIHEMELMRQYCDFEYSIENLKHEDYILMNLLNVFIYLRQEDIKNDLLSILNHPTNKYEGLIKDWNLEVNDDISNKRISKNYITKIYLEQKTNYTTKVNLFHNQHKPGYTKWLSWYQSTIWDAYKFVSIQLELIEDNGTGIKLIIIICNNLIFDCFSSQNSVPFTKYHFLKYYGKYQATRGTLYTNVEKQIAMRVKTEEDVTETNYVVTSF